MSDTVEKTKEQELKKCFVIMPISDVDGYEKGHFDRVYEHIIVPACKHEGYQPIRADGTSKANVIIVDILKNILDCDMAICDLSSRNPNVFYELGFIQAFSKKTVLMIDDKTTRPFDISAIRSFLYSSSLRIDLVNNAVDDLRKALKDTCEMSDQEPNSLLKLLSIESPAQLPDTHQLSDDSSLILQAIQDLGQNMQRTLRRRRVIDGGNAASPCAILPNGQNVKVGDYIYDRLSNRELGEVVETTPVYISVKDANNDIEFIELSSAYANNLSTLPF